MFLALLLGALFGFFGAIPVAGPVSAMIVKWGLQQREADGRLLAAGAALAESIYVVLAALGYATLLKSFPVVDTFARALASLILTGIGLYFVTKAASIGTSPDSAPVEREKNKGPFGIGFLISILNPTLMVTWTTALAWIHGWRMIDLGLPESIALAAGSGVGIVLWFTLMLRWLSRSGKTVTESTLIRLIQGTGWVLVALGLHGIRGIFYSRQFLFL
jgi:threonine/homoserine/homoserine lactone efflux protein